MKNGFRPSSLLLPHPNSSSHTGLLPLTLQVVLRNSEATTDLFLRDFSLLIPYPYPESGNLVFQETYWYH